MSEDADIIVVSSSIDDAEGTHLNALDGAISNLPEPLPNLPSQDFTRLHLGTGILRRLYYRCVGMIDPTDIDTQHPDFVSQILDRPLPEPVNVSNAKLPPKGRAQRLVELAIQTSFPLWPFVQYTLVQPDFDLVQELETHTSRSLEQEDQMALYFVLLALGIHVSWVRAGSSQVCVCEPHAPSCRSCSVRYFHQARALAQHDRDEWSLCGIQLFMSLAQYVQCVESTSASIPYIATASTAALRMGLYRVSDPLPANPLRCTFAAVRILDTLTACTVGAPPWLAREASTLHPGDTTPETILLLIEGLGQYLYEASSPFLSFERICGAQNYMLKCGESDGHLLSSIGSDALAFYRTYASLLIGSRFVYQLPTTNLLTQCIAMQAIVSAADLVGIAEGLKYKLRSYPQAAEALLMATMVLRLYEICLPAETVTTLFSDRALSLLIYANVGRTTVNELMGKLRAADFGRLQAAQSDGQITTLPTHPLQVFMVYPSSSPPSSARGPILSLHMQECRFRELPSLPSAGNAIGSPQMEQSNALTSHTYNSNPTVFHARSPVESTADGYMLAATTSNPNPTSNVR